MIFGSSWRPLRVGLRLQPLRRFAGLRRRRTRAAACCARLEAWRAEEACGTLHDNALHDSMLYYVILYYTVLDYSDCKYTLIT